MHMLKALTLLRNKSLLIPFLYIASVLVSQFRYWGISGISSVPVVNVHAQVLLDF